VRPQPGAIVRVEMTKWGERPHWGFDAVYLGSDEHGDWLGFAAGTSMSRPGASYVAPNHQVGLVPAPGPDEARGWLATFHGRGAPVWESLGAPVEIYVDMTTPPFWDGPVLRATDLDLDVVRGTTGRVWVDDEDEFAAHRVEYGYPDDVVRLATSSCDRVRAAMLAREAPYDGEAPRAWLAMVSDLVGG
jgi:hypothetical protein